MKSNSRKQTGAELRCPDLVVSAADLPSVFVLWPSSERPLRGEKRPLSLPEWHLWVTRKGARDFSPKVHRPLAGREWSAKYCITSLDPVVSLVAAHSIAGPPDVDDRGVVEESVDDGAGDDRLAEDLGPVAETSIGGQDDGALLLALGDHVEHPVG